jgi:hypothetical protein
LLQAGGSGSGFLLAPDLREWLPAGDPVWVVIEIVSEHSEYRAAVKRPRFCAAQAGWTSHAYVHNLTKIIDRAAVVAVFAVS